MYLKYAVIRDGINPNRGHSTDAGIDFYVPKFNDEFLSDLEQKNPNCFKNFTIKDDEIIIQPNDSILIPSGIKVEIPYGYMGLFLNKSGVASKKGLLIGAQVIDTFYSGEVHINLHNVSARESILKQDDKIVQMVLVPILSCDLSLVDEDMLYDWMNEDKVRGEGGFGSTNA